MAADPSIQSLWLRELGYAGGKSIFYDYVRDVRPRFVRPRAFQRTIYRPGEVGAVRSVGAARASPGRARPHGQTRRGYVAAAELCWSRVVAGALVFSKEAPDILWGLNRCLGRIGVLREKLVWDREGAIHAGGGRPTDELAAFCGQGSSALAGSSWKSADPQAMGILERSHRFMRTNFEPGRRFANHLDFQGPCDGWCDRVNQ